MAESYVAQFAWTGWREIAGHGDGPDDDKWEKDGRP